MGVPCIAVVSGVAFHYYSPTTVEAMLMWFKRRKQNTSFFADRKVY